MPIYALGDLVPEIHPDAYVHPEATVIGNVIVEAESSIWPQAVLRGDHGQIVVGSRTSIQDGAVIHATDRHHTIIGSECVIGHLAHMEGCIAEDQVLVGVGAVVLHRVILRTGSLVGAGAVVPNDMEVPSKSMALGVPAKIRLDSVDPQMMVMNAAGYVANGRRFKADLRRID